MLDETLTERLLLTPVDATDDATVAAVFALQSDPATWAHLPDGVETDISQSRSMLESYARSWRDYGLGWWTIRLRQPLDGVDTDTIVGLGGVAIRRPEVHAWNLGYRLSPTVWGHGLAGEVSRAARDAAGSAGPGIPVTARALTRNPASWRTLERAGLTLAWEGDAPADDPLTSGLLRRVYADRPLAPGLLQQLIAVG